MPSKHLIPSALTALLAVTQLAAAVEAPFFRFGNPETAKAGASQPSAGGNAAQPTPQPAPKSLQVTMGDVRVHQTYGSASSAAAATGAAGAVAYALDSTLPGWIGFSAGRASVNMPSVPAGSYGPYAFTATDADGTTGKGSFNVTVLPPPTVTGIPLSKSPPQYSFPDLYVMSISVGTPIVGAVPTFSTAVGGVTWRFGGGTGQSGGAAITDCSTVPSTAAGRGLSVDPSTGRISGTPNGNTPNAACYLVEGFDAGDNATAAYRVLMMRQ